MSETDNMKRKKSPVNEVNASKGDKAAPPPAPSGGNNLALAAAQILQQAQQQSAAASSVASTAPTAPSVPASTTASTATSANAAAAADTLQTLASIMTSAAAANNLLPNSAPVSSLLPPIPALNPAQVAATASGTQQQQPHGQHPQQQQSAISNQIAALLAGASAGGSVPSSSAPQPTAQPPRFAPQAAPQPHHSAAAANNNPLLRHPAAAAASAQQVAAAAVAASAVPAALGVPNMQHWSLEQLQQQAQLYEQLKQPVPQSVSLLLADAKRKEQKRNAKRIANRKSASTSRARKKAYVQEMTELNARLKRQALILSLLPDMVIVIGVQGNITFCSAQVERILRYDMEELVGVNLSKLLVPASREKLNRLIKQLLGAPKVDRKAVAGRDTKEDQPLGASDQGESNLTPGGASSGAENSAEPGAAIVSGAQMSGPSSFPLSVVQVEAKREKPGKKKSSGVSDDRDSSDSSNPGKQPSSLTMSNSSQITATAVDGAAVEDGGVGQAGNGGAVGARKGAPFPSSDVSNSSSLSTNAKNVQQANTNLERNVRIHNKKMKSGSQFKDDVTGADVTANNASARLSSLQHRPESSSSEEDSGYRESNDSREETSSSVSDSSGSNGRRKPLAPTCNICLIRKDLTTLWCEVTSSIRTKEPEEDSLESVSATDSNKKLGIAGPKTPPPGGMKSPTNLEQMPPSQGEEKGKELEEKELLLCLRPIRDGDQGIHDKLRFGSTAPSKKHKKKRHAPDTSSNWTGASAGAGAPSATGLTSPNRPFKKRGLAEVSKDTTTTATTAAATGQGGEAPLSAAAEMDTDAAESLMLMTKSP